MFTFRKQSKKSMCIVKSLEHNNVKREHGIAVIIKQTDRQRERERRERIQWP